MAESVPFTMAEFLEEDTFHIADYTKGSTAYGKNTLLFLGLNILSGTSHFCDLSFECRLHLNSKLESVHRISIREDIN